MRHKTIKRVFGRIRKKRQLIGLEVDGFEKIVYLVYPQIRDILNIDSSQLEALTGSTIRPVFFKKGEIMPDGRICETEEFIIKDFWITLSGTIEELLLKNKDLLIPFHKIRDILVFNRNGVDNVCIKVYDSDQVFFLTLLRIVNFTGIEKSEIHILKDSFFSAEYYKIGDIMFGGKACFEDNKIIKEFTIRLSGNINQMHQNFEESNYYLDDNDNESFNYEEAEELAFQYAFEGDWNNYWNVE